MINLKINIKVSIRIILLFTVAILISKVPELYPSFFGDIICQGNGNTGNRCIYGMLYSHGINTHHWGYQHWLFFFMGLSLFIVQAVDIVLIIIKHNKS